jgi:muramoyltetrapeptide carboxypeptidase LdcA involved in peptidoglycan recycling
VLRAVADYNPELVAVLDVDFGHTSPHLLLPYGGRVTVDGEQQVITALFGAGDGRDTGVRNGSRRR